MMKIVILGNINKIFSSQFVKYLRKQLAQQFEQELILYKVSVHKEKSFLANRKKIIDFQPDIILSSSASFIHFKQMNDLFDYLAEQLQKEKKYFIFYENDDDLLKQLIKQPTMPIARVQDQNKIKFDEIQIKNIYYKIPIVKTLFDTTQAIKKQVVRFLSTPVEKFEDEFQASQNEESSQIYLKDLREIELRYYTIDSIFHEMDLKKFPQIIEERINEILFFVKQENLQNTVKQLYQDDEIDTNSIKICLISQYEMLKEPIAYLLHKEEYRFTDEMNEADLVIDFENVLSASTTNLFQLGTQTETLLPSLKKYDASTFNEFISQKKFENDDFEQQKKTFFRRYKSLQKEFTQLQSRLKLVEFELNINEEAEQNLVLLSQLLDQAYVFKQYYPRKINTENLLFLSFDEEKDQKARIKYKQVKQHLWFNLSFINDLESFTKINFEHFNIFKVEGTILIQESCLNRLNGLIDKIKHEIEAFDHQSYKQMQEESITLNQAKETVNHHLKKIENEMIHLQLYLFYNSIQEKIKAMSSNALKNKIDQMFKLQSIEKIQIIGKNKYVLNTIALSLQKIKQFEIEQQIISLYDYIDEKNQQLNQQNELIEAVKNYIIKILFYFQSKQNQMNIMIEDIDLFLKYFSLIKKKTTDLQPAIFFLYGNMNDEKLKKISHYPFRYIIFNQTKIGEKEFNLLSDIFQ